MLEQVLRHCLILGSRAGPNDPCQETFEVKERERKESH